MPQIPRTFLILALLLVPLSTLGAALKVTKCSAQAIALASQITWVPGAVKPELSLPLIIMLNSPPNTWIQFGKPEGKSFYQRGYNNSYDGSNNLRVASLQDGAAVALKVFAGTLNDTLNDFSILPSFSASETYRKGINQGFAYPLMVRGKFPEKYKKTLSSIGSVDPTNRSVQIPGDQVTPTLSNPLGYLTLEYRTLNPAICGPAIT